MEAVRVTEAAALAASLFVGCGDEKAADQAAVDAMQAALSSLTINGTVRIGEGREGEAGKLYVGEKVGTGEGTKTSVAIVPLEGKSIVARGGQMQGRLVLRNGDERAAAQAAGIEDLERTYSIDEMAAGNITFAATGVTYGAMLEGVRNVPGGAITHSMVVRSVTGTLHYIEGYHDFSRRSRYG